VDSGRKLGHPQRAAYDPVMRVLAALAVFFIAVPVAHAGRTHYGWLYDTETIPERQVELETWVFEEDGKGDPDENETTIWWAPVVGITDRLELALPIEFGWHEVEGAGGGGYSTQIDRVGLEARWRLMSPDPVESGPFAVLLRLSVKRVVPDREQVRLEGGVVLSYDVSRLHLTADLGWLARVGGAEDGQLEARPGLGLSVRVGKYTHVGVESYAELRLRGDSIVSWISAGPNVALTRGRFWFALSVPIGLQNIDAAPRLNWGVAF
jgi:hypothetical protein